MFVQPKFWRTINLASILLVPLGFLYRLISQLRYKLQTPIRFKSAKVICIGNATVGGSGKTPLAIALGKIVLDLKIDGLRKPQLAYACKNYGPCEVLDEALLLARIASTFVAPRRIDAIQAACDGADVVIVDDGLQNNSFSKDLSILAVSDDKSFRNRLIFPAGPMRETLLDSLKKSDFVFLMNERGISHAHSRRLIEQHFDMAKVFSTVYRYKLCRGAVKVPAVSHKKKFLAFCGIANPDRFFDALIGEGIRIVKRVTYPDHHSYTDQDLCWLTSQARLLNAVLISTEKDLVKLSRRWQSQVMCLKLAVCIR